MKFVYQYRTSTNCLCSGVVHASTREAAFLALREEGIRPSRVEVAPGILNYLVGMIQRWQIPLLMLFVGIVVAVYLTVSIYSRKHLVGEMVEGGLTPAIRHQIYGDPALLAKWDKEGYASVFSSKGDRLLACFAQPGKESKGGLIDDGQQISSDIANALADCLAESITSTEGDAREAVELKQIVLWMKGELRDFISSGETVEAYARELVRRQRKERQILELTKKELDGVRDASVWDEKNAALRRLGLATIPVPEDLY